MAMTTTDLAFFLSTGVDLTGVDLVALTKPMVEEAQRKFDRMPKPSIGSAPATDDKLLGAVRRFWEVDPRVDAAREARRKPTPGYEPPCS